MYYDNRNFFQEGVLKFTEIVRIFIEKVTKELEIINLAFGSFL